ncbi:MAG: Fic family protein [Actinomycetia bacterium]|nr:Fic family protein [Actinomycetes bacterium]
MKIPESPPEYESLLAKLADADREAWIRSIAASSAVDPKGRYLHWDEMKRRTPPADLTHEQWWFGTTMARRAFSRPLPLVGVDDKPFTYSNIDYILEMVHRVDQQASGQILADDVVTNLRSSDRYLVSSLVEEAITSSQLEGASTTRRVAKELLRTGRRPRDRSEQMILNNYRAMLAAEELAATGDKLTVEAVCELHRLVTEEALDDPSDAGRIQGPGEDRIAVHWHDDKILHRPPPAEQLPGRLERLCEFANGDLSDGFIHPVVRAIVTHFWLAYDHPFVDGNGRTARALFYWSMLQSGYWLTQYISISSILRKAPAKYARSYLHVETDRNDMTYFIVYQLTVIDRAIESLREYLSRKVAETRRLETQLRGSAVLNHRQLVVVGDALRDPTEQFTIQAHSRRHSVTYQSARTDLLRLVELGLFRKTKSGKKYVFWSEPDLPSRLKALEAA